MVANDLKLDNLTIVYDHNQSQQRSLQIHAPKEKFEAFAHKEYNNDSFSSGIENIVIMDHKISSFLKFTKIYDDKEILKYTTVS